MTIRLRLNPALFLSSLLSLVAATALQQADARPSWFTDSCEAAARQNRYYIEVQQGDEVVRIDCIGEIIEIHDEGDDGPSLPGGSTKPGSGDDAGGEGGPSGGGSGSPYADPCDACAQTANKCRANAHAFRKICMGAGYRYVTEQCSGWGDADKPRNCDGSALDDYTFQLATKCDIISFDKKGEPLPRQVCFGPFIDRCIDACMKGTGGGGGGGISIAGTGISGSVNVPATDGVNKICTQTASTLGTNCGQEEAACRKKHACDVNSLRGATSRGTIADRFGRVLTQKSGDAILIENLSEADLRKLGAQHWLADYLGEAYLGRVNEQKFLALIGEATARYLVIYHAQQPGKAPAASGATSGGGASGKPSMTTKAPTKATKTMSGDVYSYQKQTTTAGAQAANERAPDLGPRFEDARTLPKVDEIFLRKAFLFLTPKQEELLLESWPGGQLVFGSGIIRVKE